MVVNKFGDYFMDLKCSMAYHKACAKQFGYPIGKCPRKNLEPNPYPSAS